MQCSSFHRQCLGRQACHPTRLNHGGLRALAPTAVGDGPSTSEPIVQQYVIRRGTTRDAQSLAHVCAESFGRGNFPGVQSEPLDRLEDRYALVIEESMQVKLVNALEAKEQASQEHREFRLQQYMQQLRAQLAALRGEAARFVAQLSAADLRLVQRWRRSRQFLVLLAEEEAEHPIGAGVAASATPGGSNSLAQGHPAGPSHPPRPEQQPAIPAAPAAASGSIASSTQGHSQASPGRSDPGPGRRRHRGAVVGCATLSLMQPEALLPPPFPSGKPFRLYVSNMSVLPVHRRRGVARRLLQRCERVARLWGHTSLWLHVQRTNTAAAALYHSMGYRPVEEGGMRFLPGPLAQVLMCKDLPPRPSSCPVVLGRQMGNGGGGTAGGDTSGGVTGVTGARRQGDGVFVWHAEVEEGEGGSSS